MPKTIIEPRWCDPIFHTADNQPALLPRIRTARAAHAAQIEQEHLRRALYAACERAPFLWEKALPVHPEPVEGAPLGWENASV